MERGRRALRACMRRASGGGAMAMAALDTSPRSGTPLGREFELREGAYHQVCVEAAPAPARLRGRVRWGKEAGAGAGAGVGRRLVFEGGRNVEEVALDAYVGLGYQGLFSECRLYRGLFRLLLWEQVLDPCVPGAIVCPLPFPTRLPLDLEHGRTFYLRREASIEARLRELEALGRAKRLGPAVAGAWDRHWPACAAGGGGGGRWTCPGLTRRGAVELACGLAQAGLLVPILRHLAQNLAAWSRGLPDLVVWAPAGAVTGALPAGGKAGARPDAVSASTEKHVWQRRHAVRRMVEYRRRVQAQEAEAAAAAAALGAVEGQEMEGGGEEDYETPEGGGMVVVEDREGEEEEEDLDEDAETVGSDEDDAEDDLEEGEEGERLAAVLRADEPLSPLQEMAASQQRAALLMTQAPDVLLEEDEAAGQPAGRSSYESVVSLAPSSPAALSPLSWAAGDPAVEVKLVEVKSGNDFLSDYQIAWITRFVKHAFVMHPSGGAAAAADAVVRDGAAPPCGAFELCHVRSVARK